MGESGRGLVILFKSTDETGSINEDRYVAILNENGFHGELVQTLSFEFQSENLKLKLLRPENYSGMVFTSQRSVESVCKADPDLHDDWREKLNYCVGKKTCETALKLLKLSRVVGQDCGNAELLASMIVKDFHDGCLSLPLLFPCSSLKMDTLPETLRKHKISVDTVTSYITVPHPNLQENILKISQKEPNYFVFFSPSGVRFSLPFLKKTNLLGKVKIICIGHTTARALIEVDIAVDQICAKPSPEDMIETLNRLSK